MLNLYVIEYRNGKIGVMAKNRDEAFAKFFKSIKDGKFPIEDIGQIIILYDGKTQYPFRTAPLLWKMGVIDLETAVVNIMRCTNTSKAQAKLILYECAVEDSRLIPLINRLKEREKRRRETLSH